LITPETTPPSIPTNSATAPFTVPNETLHTELGIDRHEKYRALARLEVGGLIKARREGKTVRVKIL